MKLTSPIPYVQSHLATWYGGCYHNPESLTTFPPHATKKPLFAGSLWFTPPVRVQLWTCTWFSKLWGMADFTSQPGFLVFLSQLVVVQAALDKKLWLSPLCHQISTLCRWICGCYEEHFQPVSCPTLAAPSEENLTMILTPLRVELISFYCCPWLLRKPLTSLYRLGFLQTEALDLVRNALCFSRGETVALDLGEATHQQCYNTA